VKRAQRFAAACAVALGVALPDSRLSMLVADAGETLSDAAARSVVAQARRAPVRVIYVRVEDPAASDNNPGTAGRPFKTISRAARAAVAENVDGLAATVMIGPGTYREAIVLPPGGTMAPLTFQATAAGKAVVSGSDVWRGWTRWGDRGIYVHPWPYAWGPAHPPPGWPALREIVRRREMIFANAQLLAQVLGLEQMTPQTFFVDEHAHAVYIWPPRDVDPNAGTIEVAVRDPVFKAEGRANLTIRGLVFQHAATTLDASAVTVDGLNGFVAEDITVRWNNWGGFGVTNSAHVIVRRSTGNHNGARGMSNWKNRDMLYEDTETSYNNWRGAWGGFYGWGVAGIKNLLLHHGVFRRHKSVGNETYGFWLDTDNREVTVEDGYWCDNADGAFVEASQGPIVIARTIICKNRSSGLITSVSGHVTVRDSVLYDNGTGAQFATNDMSSGTVTDWETGQVLILRTENWQFCGNAFVATRPGQELVSVASWDFFQRTLRSSQNLYWNPVRRDVFRIRGSGIGGRSLDLPGWQRALGQDAGSVFADPGFADAPHWDFTPLPSSPWHRCG
jgi:hypothetical protein